jgi:hypothetical protein
MKPLLGVLIEIAALAVLLALIPFVPMGLPLCLYVVIAELMATYLVHCPAHYLVGRIVGIRFRRIRLGKTTLANILPARLARLTRLFPVLTLSTVKSSLAGVSKKEVAMMYQAGTVASVCSALLIAAAATLVEPPLYAALAWAVALGYLIFDLVFSPKSGDLSRARAALLA